MDLQFLEAFKPDGDALLRRISPHVDDAALELIADQDPIGSDSRRASFISALRKLRDGGPLMKQSDFASWDEFFDQDVTEFLQASWFAEPDTDRNKPPWRGTRGHWTRAFASAVLLRSYADYEVRTYVPSNYNEAMIQLIESLRRLDAGFEAETMAALAWFIVRAYADRWDDIEHNQRAFAGVGILSLAVNSGNMVPHDTIMRLSDWLIAGEERAFGEWGQGTGDFPHHWLFRITSFDHQREKWMAIGAELAACNVTGPCGDAVRGIGQKLSGQTPMT